MWTGWWSRPGRPTSTWLLSCLPTSPIAPPTSALLIAMLQPDQNIRSGMGSACWNSFGTGLQSKWVCGFIFKPVKHILNWISIVRTNHISYPAFFWTLQIHFSQSLILACSWVVLVPLGWLTQWGSPAYLLGRKSPYLPEWLPGYGNQVTA